ncbi:MAG: choice-of-anchor P family protein [Acidimicrobiales bacterium]
MRRARRIFAVAAAICLLLAVGVSPSSAQDDEVAPPEVFRGSASSQVVSVQVDRADLLPVPDLFKFIALDGASTFESSFREARSSLLFPGNGLILGPSLACGTFGGQFPPEFKPVLDTCLQYSYPLTVFADDFKPKGATAGALAFGGPTDAISGNAVGAKASVGEAITTTDAVMQDLRVLGVPPFGAVSLPIPGLEIDTSLLTIDSATSRTSQRIVQGGLVTEARATISGVRMLGGLIEIESLVSTSQVTDDAQGKRTAVPSLVMSGVTVAGQPAQITDKGLVLGPSGAASPLDQQIQGQINGVLEALGVKVTILGSEQSLDEGGAAVANVGGLLLEFAHDVQGLPTTPTLPIPGVPNTEVDPNGLYVGSIQLGATGVLGSAVNYGIDDLDVPLVDDDGFFDLGGTGFDVGGYDVASPSFTDTPAGVATGGTPRITGRNTDLARSLGGVFGDRIGLLYLSLMFAVLACCITPRFTVPARLPGRSS